MLSAMMEVCVSGKGLQDGYVTAGELAGGTDLTTSQAMLGIR